MSLKYSKTLDKFKQNSLFRETLDFCSKLIEQESITPDKSNALDMIASRLEKLGFKNEWLIFKDVRNLYSVYQNGSPLLMFAGHSDVVPTGEMSLWKYPPFKATQTEKKLYGRGSADMKSAIAAFLIACEKLLKNHSIDGSIAFLITADEEALAINGTKKVVEELIKRKIKVDYCLVGEPSSLKKTGDTLKNGRRGSLSAQLKIIGKQGHIAYPHNADNPIHKIPIILSSLLAIKWDEGNQYFEPTCLQFSNIHSGTGATNVIAHDCVLDFNFRYSTEITQDELKSRVEKVLANLKIKYQISWQESGNPFLSEPKKLTNSIRAAIEKIQGFKPKITTGGGTSDGRYITQLNCEIIECGLTNKTIHQINESINYQELNDLCQIYYQSLKNQFNIR